MKILVTGYGGFLGASLCRQLIYEGFSVRGLARQAYPNLEQLGVESVQGDACRIADCRAAADGVDAIIHTAAIAGVWGKRETFEAINVGATQNLLQTARELRIKSFVHCSSPSVTFNGQPQSNVDESAPYPTQWLCDYPRTKALAEQSVLAANKPGALLTCALRPHLIWGEGDPHLIPRLISKCKARRLRRVGDGKNLIDTVHVDSAAQAHVLALKRLLEEKVEVAGRPYFVTDGEPIGCWEWLQLILEHAGLSAPTGSISINAAFRIGHAFEWAYGLLKISKEPPMTRFIAAQLGVDHYFSIEAARRYLGYNPVCDRGEKLGAMANWLRKLAE